MEPMQALQPGGRGRPSLGEHGPGARLRRLERGTTAAMEQASIIEAGHDGHERIESRTVFGYPSACARRGASAGRRGWHAGSLPGPRRGRRSRQIASGPVRRCSAGGVQIGPAAAPERPPWPQCWPDGSPNGAGRAATSKPSAQIAPRWALLPSVAASIRRSISRPIRPSRSRSRSDGSAPDAALRNGGETVSQGPGGTAQSLQIEIVMRPVTSPVHECRLRRQFRFLDQRGNRRGRQIERRAHPRRLREWLRSGSAQRRSHS